MAKQVRFQEKSLTGRLRSSKWFSFQHFKPAISRGRCCLKDLTFSASCQESASFASPASTEKDAAFLCVKTLSGAFGMYMKKKRGFYVAVPARGLISTAKFLWAIQKFFQAIISNQSPILMCWIFLLFALQLLVRCNAFRISTCFGKKSPPFGHRLFSTYWLTDPVNELCCSPDTQPELSCSPVLLSEPNEVEVF